jgi:hypothetical protein
MLSQRHIKGEDGVVENIRVVTRDLILTTLQERSYVFSRKVSYIIGVCGYKFAADVLGKTLLVEIEGGMLTVDESRRRLMGGTYMQLADELMTEEQRREVERLERKTARKIEADKAAKEARKAARLKAEAKAKAERQSTVQATEAGNAPTPEVVAQQPKAKNGKAAKTVATKKYDPTSSRQARFQVPGLNVTDLRDDLPPNVKARLKQLQDSNNVLRNRVQQLEANPPAQQMGLEMARKLLASNESQIAALLAEHERSGEGVT